MEIKRKGMFGVLVAFLLCCGAVGYGAMGSPETAQAVVYGNNAIKTQNESLLGMLVGVLVGVLVAVTLLPIIGSQVTTIEGDTTNFSATEITLLGLIPTIVIIGVFMAIIGMAL